MSLAIFLGYVIGQARPLVFYELLVIGPAIAVLSGLPAITGGWILSAGMITAPIFAATFAFTHEHEPHIESNDTLLSVVLWLLSSLIVALGASAAGLARSRPRQAR